MELFPDKAAERILPTIVNYLVTRLQNLETLTLNLERVTVSSRFFLEDLREAFLASLGDRFASS